MGIEIALIDIDSPRGFTFVVPRQRRIMVQRSHTMGQIVDQIFAMCRPRSLDVIRIEAHGEVEGPFNAIVNRVEFGAAFNADTVSAFRSIRSLWSQPWQMPMYNVQNGYMYEIPRIEMHGCEVVPLIIPTLQALASYALTNVFGSSASQDVDARDGQNPYAIEGQVYRFVPEFPLPYIPVRTSMYHRRSSFEDFDASDQRRLFGRRPTIGRGPTIRADGQYRRV